MRHILVLLIALILSGRSYQVIAQTDTVYYDLNWKKIDKAHASFYRHGRRLSNIIRVDDHYLNGNLQMTGTYLLYGDSEVANGYFIYYDSSGNKEAAGFYENSYKVDTWQYYKDSTLMSEEHYYDGTDRPLSKHPYYTKTYNPYGSFDGTRWLPPSAAAHPLIDVDSFIKKNLRYPTAALKKKFKGVVLVNFVVNADGSITNAEIVQGLRDDCNKEALRLFSIMPRWAPAQRNGVAIKSQQLYVVAFNLK